jgi:DNA-binding CsgD family transcriptional regulator/tetratricopeptide (TPR) repeat protein
MELLEREAFLESLTSYADEALLGQGRVVLVAGEAGVGKTALIEAFQERMPGATWAWGACDGLSTPRPLAPLHDVARELGGALLTAVRAGAPREELFDALVSRLDGGSDLTVVVVEDVHWADEATLDLVRHVARRLTSARALLLLTYRDDGLAADDMLRTALGDLSSYRGTRRMALPPLSEQAVARLAAGSPIAPAVLHRLTAGNPYFLSEVLAGHGEQVPPSARDAVLARAARLGPAARAALDVAALVGARQDPTLLRGLPGVTGEALDACVASGLLAELGPTLAFRHDLARLAVAAAVPPHRRVELHREILAALVRSGDEDHVQLAHHADEAGDSAAVLEHAPAAARAAADLGSHRESAAQWQRATRHAAVCPPRQRAELLEELAMELSLLDRYEETLEARQEALAIWRELGDELRAGDELRLLVSPLWRLCRGEEADRTAQEAVALLEPLPPGRELAAAWQTLASVVGGQGDWDESARLARMAKSLARELDLPDVLSDALNTESGAVGVQGGDPVPLLREALAIALAGRFELQVGRAYCNLYAVLTEAWQVQESEPVFFEATGYCDPRDMATYSTCQRGQRMWSLRQQGRTAEALALSEEVKGVGIPSPVNKLNPLMTAGALAARLGERAEAWSALDEAVELAKRLEEGAWTTRVQRTRCEAFWLEGRIEEAAEAARAAHQVLDGPDAWDVGEAAVWCRRLGVVVGSTGGVSAPALPWALELAGDHRASAEEWDRLGGHYLAALALAFSDDEQDLRDALERFTVMEAPAAAARVRQLLRERGASDVPAGPRATTRAHPAGLTRRESEVLEGLARGLTNADLAAELFLSERTVEHHVSSVLGKLQVATRADAAREADRRGLLDAVAT